MTVGDSNPETHRWAVLRDWTRSSSVPYLGSLLLTAMSAGWANYLSPLIWPDGFLIKGQALAIVIPLLLFPVSLLLWVLYKGHRVRNVWAAAFLIGLAVSWVIHMLILRYHGDQYPHVVWLFVPVLAMVLFKAPSSQDCWTLITIFAWTAVVIIITTRILEMVNAIPMFKLDPGIIEWEQERYWLPVSQWLGIDGRWPGPFGYNSKTGFIGALLILIGIARWTRSSWIFTPVGLLVILATASRGSFLALAAGVVVLAIFATKGPVSRIPIVVRAFGLAMGVIAVGVLFLRNPIGTTGRSGPDGIWSNFLTLWEDSPWLGVGQVGILADPKAGISMEAHNLFIQHLTRFGVVGFAVQYLVLAIALGLMVVAAYRGLSWPLAITAAYYVASITEVFQDGWLQHTTYSLILILCTLAASAYLTENRKSAPTTTSAHERAVGLAGTPAD